MSGLRAMENVEEPVQNRIFNPKHTNALKIDVACWKNSGIGGIDYYITFIYDSSRFI